MTRTWRRESLRPLGQPSLLTFAAWKLVSASLSHVLDGLGSLRASSGGPDVLACTASYATTEGYEAVLRLER